MLRLAIVMTALLERSLLERRFDAWTAELDATLLAQVLRVSSVGSPLRCISELIFVKVIRRVQLAMRRPAPV